MKTPTFLWGFFLADFNYKTGEKLRFLTKMCPPVGVSPIYIYMPHTSIGGQFWGFEIYRSRGKKENKAEKGKRREKREKRKTNLQPQFVGCKIGAFFTIKLGKNAKNGLYLPMKWGVGHIYIYADESNNGTQISEKQVKQRDARTLNNGTRLVSRYKNSGFALFWVYAISDAGSSVWVIDDAEPWKLVGLVFRIFGPPGNRMSSFWGFVSFSLNFFDLEHWKHYKNRGFRERASEDMLPLEPAFYGLR